MIDPVHFTSQLKMLEGDEAEIVFSATVDPGWHVYSTDLGNDGPISATFNAVKMDGVETVGKLKPRGNVTKQFEKMFDMELRFFEHKATFVQKIRFTKPQYNIDCYLEYGACNDEMCMPPTQVELKKSGRVELSAQKEDDKSQAESAEVVKTDTVAASASNDTISARADGVGEDALWSPVIDELRSQGGNDSISNHSLLYILLMGFVIGMMGQMQGISTASNPPTNPISRM